MTKPTNKKLEVIERRASVWSLRKTGKTLQEIADELYVSIATVRRDIDALIEQYATTTKLDVTEWKLLEIERLEALNMWLWSNAQTGDYGAIDRLIKISERRSKLLGLDAPARNVNVTITPEQAEKLSDDDLDTELRRRGLL